MFDTADTVTGTNAFDSATCSDGDDNGCCSSQLVPLMRQTGVEDKNENEDEEGVEMLCLMQKDIGRSDAMSWRSQQYQQVSCLPTGWREMCIVLWHVTAN